MKARSSHRYRGDVGAPIDVHPASDRAANLATPKLCSPKADKASLSSNSGLPAEAVLGKVPAPARGLLASSVRTRPMAKDRRSPSIATFAATTLLACLLACTGCSKTYIPNTDVEDNAENRRLITFCEDYRHAVERQNVAELIKLASPDYYEDGGNVDASDDLDYAGLKDYLTSRFEDAKSIRYEIRYRRVTKERDRIYIDYTYSASFRVPTEKGADEWQRKVDDNRLELVQKNDAYLIIGGM